MSDRLTPAQRRLCMQHIHSKGTKPEMIVRQYLHAHGFRYRLHHDRLPGHPDLVLRKYRTCIFVNGCFWHGHEGCRYHSIPKTNTEFWTAKIEHNRERDREDIQKLKEMGWHTIIVWECQLKPAVREASLKSLAYTLNYLQLLNCGARNVQENEGLIEHSLKI